MSTPWTSKSKKRAFIGGVDGAEAAGAHPQPWAVLLDDFQMPESECLLKGALRNLRSILCLDMADPKSQGIYSARL